MHDEPDIHLEVLLREGKRSTANVQSVTRELKALGAEIASQGTSVITVRIPASRKDAFFHMLRRARLLDADAERMFPISETDEKLEVPLSLTDNVEIITVPPRHLQF